MDRRAASNMSRASNTGIGAEADAHKSGDLFFYAALKIVGSRYNKTQASACVLRVDEALRA